MSTGTLLVGKRGQGKTLAAVGRMHEYLLQGRVIATNVNLYLEHLVGPLSKKVRVYRVPDFPTPQDFLALPLGNPKLFYKDDGSIGIAEGYTDEENGLLCLDEVASFLNARDWNDKEKKPTRDAINDWLRHSRKYGWDVLFLTQHEDLIDKQTRTAMFELFGTAKRLDRVAIPVLTPITKAIGIPLKFPKVHVAVIRYGFAETSPVSDRWMYRGVQYYHAYDTTQQLGTSDVAGIATILPPYYTHGRYFSKARQFAMKAIVAFIPLITGLVIGSAVTAYYLPKLQNKPTPVSAAQAPASAPSAVSPVRVVGTVVDGWKTNIILENGKSGVAQEIKITPTETKALVDGVWYSTAQKATTP